MTRGSDPPDDRSPRPPLAGILLVCGLLAAAPWVSPAGVGAYRMFTAPVEYRLDVAVADASGFPRRVPLRALEPHVGRDARRVVGAARRYVVGETNAALLASGLGDLAELVCALHPGAESARLVLWRREPGGDPLPRIDEVHRCDR